MYIHQYTCISPQPTFEHPDLAAVIPSSGNQLKAIEPSYEGIPPGILRRMGKAVRMGIGAALPLVKAHAEIDGIIIGTANGGMEDCIRFLNQIIDYEEGMLAPGNFVQSTPNAIAGQLGLMSGNKAYNITHVHRGLAFENALLDALLRTKEHPGKTCLLGAVDEIASYNFNIDLAAGWYKREIISSQELYSSSTSGSIAGEGAAMFLVNDQPAGAAACIRGISMSHASTAGEVATLIRDLLQQYLPEGESIDLLLTGENGDQRLKACYDAAETAFDHKHSIARYKHLSGEYPTSTGMGLWLACYFLQGAAIPEHMLKAGSPAGPPSHVLLYNTYKGAQHSLLLVSKK